MKLINLIRQEEAFNKCRKIGFEDGKPSTESKKRSFREMTQNDIAADGDIPLYIDRLLEDEDIIGGISSKDKADKFDKTNKDKRPANWREIAEDFEINGSSSTLTKFPEANNDRLGNRLKESTIETRLRRWKEDLNNEKQEKEMHVVNMGGRKPPYGDAIDNQLLLCVKERIASCQSVDADTLRGLLVAELQANGKADMLKENGGEYLFTKSWAQRFFMRHGLNVKLLSHKYKPLPTDFQARLTEYENSLALAIDEYNVPNFLVLSMSEIVLNFVPNSVKSRVNREPKKIRLLGIVKNKAMITTTLVTSETGEILSPQVILAGTTDRVHPSTAPPNDGYFAHSSNNLQSVDTMLDFVEKILLPYKQYMVNKHKLSQKQHMIVKLSIANAHIDVAVLQKFKYNHIVPVFVPQFCNEALSEVDVACTKVFKSEVKIAFRDHIHADFYRHVQAGGNPSDYCLDLKMSSIKGYITDFVSKGYEALTTAEMKETIKRVFAEQGRLAVCRTKERALVARVSRSVNGALPMAVSSSSSGDVMASLSETLLGGEDIWDTIVYIPEYATGLEERGGSAASAPASAMKIRHPGAGALSGSDSEDDE